MRRSDGGLNRFFLVTSLIGTSAPIFSSEGYAADYYGYMWADVLTAGGAMLDSKHSRGIAASRRREADN